MAMLLDHIIILCHSAAPEAEKFIELGFVEGNANVHPGQGTANRRFFLPGFTLELLYISDDEEAATGTGKVLGLLERQSDDGACPFGLVARVADGVDAPDFPSWLYTPEYFGGSMSFFVGDNSSVLQEPLCICMPPELPSRSSIPAEYENREWELSALKITVPVNQPSETLSIFASMDKVNIEYGTDHHLTLVFNNGSTQHSADLSPTLPVLINY